MYKKEFDSFLRTHTPRASLLYGESEFLIESYTRQILQACGLEPRVFSYGDYTLSECLEVLGASSLFGDAQCVILKLDKKPSDKDIKAILQALSLNHDHSLILAFFHAESKSPAQYARDFKALSAKFKHETIYARKVQDKAIDEKKNGVVEVRFFKPKPSEALELLRQEAQAMGISIANHLLESLLCMQSYDISIARNELKKLSMLDTPITQHDLAYLCYGLGSVAVEELLQALFTRGDVVGVFEQMVESGLSSDMTLLSELEGYFYKLFLFAVYVRLHGKPDSKEILGHPLPFQEADLLARRAMKINERAFAEIFSLLGFWRNGIMRGEKNISLRCLIKLQALLG